MPVYRLCSHCNKRVEQYKQCSCEIAKRKESYRDYQRRRVSDEKDKKSQVFYNSGDWTRCKEVLESHQFCIDLLELHKTGKVVQAECYHHIVEVKEDWDARLDIYNIIGLTVANHNKVHAIMRQGSKQKKAMQNLLNEILEKFEMEFYG